MFGLGPLIFVIRLSHLHINRLTLVHKKCPLVITSQRLLTFKSWIIYTSVFSYSYKFISNTLIKGNF